MFYEFKNGLKEIGFNDICEDVITMGVIDLEELGKYNERFKFSQTTLTQCEAQANVLHSIIDIYDDYSFGIFNLIDVSDIMGNKDKVAFYLKKNLFILVDLVDMDKSTVTAVTEVASKFENADITMEKLVFSVFMEILSKDYDGIEKLENKINSFSDIMASGKAKADFNTNITIAKKELMTISNYYSQLIDIGEELQTNVNHLFEKETLFYFKLFTNRVSRMKTNVSAMSERLVHLREEYDSFVNLNLNNTMKFFTAIATIFMPLTLIVGWYGMNFQNMPELSWKYGYLMVIIISVIVGISSIILFKKKKMF